jgi:ABC-type sugar transport system ATPase subunit
VQSGNVTLDGGKVTVASPLEALQQGLRFLAQLR